MSTFSSAIYWCYRCSTQFLRVETHPFDHNAPLSCPDCHGGLFELLNFLPPQPLPLPPPPPPPAPPEPPSSSRLRRSHRIGNDPSPSNPVTILPAQPGPNTRVFGPNYELDYYHHDNNRAHNSSDVGSGPRPDPGNAPEFIFGPGFDNEVGQFGQIELNGVGNVGRNEQSPASKAAVEAMPMVEIVGIECYCAVCKDVFEVGSLAREMPCHHIYHDDCILPWLELRNTCPVCRYVLPVDTRVEPEFNPGLLRNYDYDFNSVTEVGFGEGEMRAVLPLPLSDREAILNNINNGSNNDGDNNLVVEVGSGEGGMHGVLPLPLSNREAISNNDSGRNVNDGGDNASVNGNGEGDNGVIESNDETLGLTVWRFPSGGFAVGRFSSGRGGEREVSVVSAEVDGGFDQGGVPRRVSSGGRGGGRSRRSGGVSRTLRRVFSCFGGVRSQVSEGSPSSSSGTRVISHTRQRVSFFDGASR